MPSEIANPGCLHDTVPRGPNGRQLLTALPRKHPAGLANPNTPALNRLFGFFIQGDMACLPVLGDSAANREDLIGKVNIGPLQLKELATSQSRVDGIDSSLKADR